MPDHYVKTLVLSLKTGFSIKPLERPARIFEMTRLNIQEEVGRYLTGLMDAELTHHLGREKYERVDGDANHRNGTYSRKFCIKGIGEVEMRVPRDRNGDFNTQVLPRSKQYEDAITEDLSLMYLTGISTRSLSLISRRLIGRNISHQEVSKANRVAGGFSPPAPTPPGVRVRTGRFAEIIGP